MKTRFNLFRRNGVFYTEDTTTGKQTSLRTAISQDGLDFWLVQAFDFFAGRPACGLIGPVSFPRQSSAFRRTPGAPVGGLAPPGIFDFTV